MIVPPPELKSIIDKLCLKVASQDADKQQQFVKLVLEQDPKKFSFLKPEDHYRPYYDWKLDEAINGGEQVEAIQVKVYEKKQNENEFQKLLRDEIFGDKEQHEVKPPPPDQFSFNLKVPQELT